MNNYIEQGESYAIHDVLKDKKCINLVKIVFIFQCYLYFDCIYLILPYSKLSDLPALSRVRRKAVDFQ